MFLLFRKNIRLFFKGDDSAKEATHPVITHIIESFKDGVKRGRLRYVCEDKGTILGHHKLGWM